MEAYSSLPRWKVEREFNRLVSEFESGKINLHHSKIFAEFFEQVNDYCKSFYFYVVYYLVNGRNQEETAQKILDLSDVIIEKQLYSYPIEFFKALKLWHITRSLDPNYCLIVSRAFEKYQLRARALDFKEKYLLLKKEREPDHLKQLKQDIKRKVKGKYNVIFYTLHCAGASAIEPIISELLYEYAFYDVKSCPWWTEFLECYFYSDTAPLYVWTHSLVRNLNFSNTRLLCLYRDPRDALVSYTFHHLKVVREGLFCKLGDGSFKDTLKHLLKFHLENLINTNLLLNLSDEVCFKFSFEELKKDIFGTVCRILTFLRIDTPKELIKEKCEKWSFQAITGRNEGEEGQEVNTGYYWRKGVAGDWVNYFDDEIKAATATYLQPFLEQWGYEKNDKWADRAAKGIMSAKILQ